MSVARTSVERAVVDKAGSLAAVIMKRVARVRRLAVSGDQLAEIRRLQALAERARELDELGAHIFSAVIFGAEAESNGESAIAE
jgi:hypothetical protein